MMVNGARGSFLPLSRIAAGFLGKYVCLVDGETLEIRIHAIYLLLLIGRIEYFHFHIQRKFLKLCSLARYAILFRRLQG